MNAANVINCKQIEWFQSSGSGHIGDRLPLSAGLGLCSCPFSVYFELRLDANVIWRSLIAQSNTWLIDCLPSRQLSAQASRRNHFLRNIRSPRCIWRLTSKGTIGLFLPFIDRLRPFCQHLTSCFPLQFSFCGVVCLMNGDQNGTQIEIWPTT